MTALFPQQLWCRPSQSANLSFGKYCHNLVWVWVIWDQKILSSHKGHSHRMATLRMVQSRPVCTCTVKFHHGVMTRIVSFDQVCHVAVAMPQPGESTGNWASTLAAQPASNHHNIRESCKSQNDFRQVQFFGCISSCFSNMFLLAVLFTDFMWFLFYFVGLLYTVIWVLAKERLTAVANCDGEAGVRPSCRVMFLEHFDKSGMAGGWLKPEPDKMTKCDEAHTSTPTQYLQTLFQPELLLEIWKVAKGISSWAGRATVCCFNLLSDVLQASASGTHFAYFLSYPQIAKLQWDLSHLSVKGDADWNLAPRISQIRRDSILLRKLGQKHGCKERLQGPLRQECWHLTPGMQQALANCCRLCSWHLCAFPR